MPIQRSDSSILRTQIQQNELKYGSAKDVKLLNRTCSIENILYYVLHYANEALQLTQTARIVRDSAGRLELSVIAVERCSALVAVKSPRGRS